MRRFLIGLVIASMGLPAAANVYRTVNRLYVVPITADTFEVIEDRGVGARGIWCAAADYTRAAGLDGLRKRLYIVEPRGPSRTMANQIGVVFTVNPDEQMRNTPSSYSVSVKRRGENLGVGHAYNFCETLLDELFDRF
ncbi:hypothetical protein [Roseobacter weihaiensis]|uniref:hypothetical protein n=1 Tax=Roseobacter weihaiensis TaxID=2763262 RepID=UPI001D0B11E1|nr:hypothetical protein [Roseobacter sp. H9]